MQQRTLMLSALLVGVVCAPLSAQSFSVDFSSPSVQDVAFGPQYPDDLFNPLIGSLPPAGPTPALWFNGVGNSLGFPLEVDALSLGRLSSEFSLNPSHVYYSIDRGSRGVAGSGSADEFNLGAGGSEQSSDVFVSTLNGTNALFLDGDGLGSGGNPNTTPLGIAEPATYAPPPTVPVALGDLDALDIRTLPASPGSVLYFSVDAVAITAPAYGGAGSPADVYIAPRGAGYDAPTVGPNLPAPPAGVPQPYATATFLGLSPNDEIDALVVFDDGDGVFQAGQDVVAFSLAPGSIYLTNLDPVLNIPLSEGDVFVDGMTAMNLLGAAGPNPAILFSAESLGLLTIRTDGVPTNDNLNALDIVPEPGTFAMLCAIGLIALMRRPTVWRGV